MPTTRPAAAAVGALCLLAGSLDSSMIREASATATLTVRLPKTPAPATSIAVVAVAAETRQILASVTATRADSQVALAVRAVPQVVFADWLLADGSRVTGFSPLLRPVDGRTLTVDLSPRRVTGRIPMMINAAYRPSGFVESAGRAGTGLTGIGVPSSGFTVSGLDLPARHIARVVVTELIRDAPCYNEDGGFVVVETDPDVLAIIKAEIDFSNSPAADPSTRLTDRYVAPSRSVSGSWSSDGTNATVTLRVVDSRGTEILSNSLTGPLSMIFDINAGVARLLANAMSCAPQVEVRLTYTGMMGPYASLQADACPGVDRRGTDVIEGVVRLSSGARDPDGEVVYFGVLKRRTHLGICDLKPRNGHEDEHDYCAMSLSGTADVEITITVSGEGDGAFVRLTPVPGSGSVSVTGNCVPDAHAAEREAYLSEDSVTIGGTPAGELRVGRYTQSGESPPSTSVGEWALEVSRAVEK